MAELYPTPTRLALLRDIGRGVVLHYPAGESWQHFDDGSYSVVNARIGELKQVGWVRLGGVVTDRPYGTHHRPRQWQLTRAGEAVLAAAVRGAEAAERALGAALDDTTMAGINPTREDPRD